MRQKIKSPVAGYRMKKLSSREHGERIREGMKHSDSIGRKRVLDYNMIYAMYDSGLSLTEISEELKCSKSGLSRILTKRGK
jgi:hypothetical protein